MRDSRGHFHGHEMLNWLKWMIAGKELSELERWRVQWQESRRWMAEFPDVATALDHMRAEVAGEAVSSIRAVRDSIRKS